MRRILLNLSVLAFVAAPLAVHAASLSELTFTDQNNSADQYTFIVPTSSLVTSANTDGSTYFNLFNVAVNAPGLDTLDPPNPPIPGVPVSSTTEEVMFYNANYAPAPGLNGGLLDDNLVNNSLNIQFWGDTFYSSLVAAGGGNYTATFANGVSGVVQGFDQNPLDNPVNFNYSITSYTAPAGPAPEPSSLILLGTGAVGLLGAFRRRLVA